ncbi:MAG: hypothetical protein IT174_09850 [Acidobacteria bacterium]|nr:hypothetical protein [Acidobacteriota bacterium]
MFDWNEFKTLADELRQNETEAALRTAISRLYYAVYWRSRIFLESEGFVLRQYEASHIQIWNEYKKKTGQTNKAIGKTGSELHRFRVQADYVSEVRDITRLTADSFRLAENVLSYLNQIERKSNK